MKTILYLTLFFVSTLSFAQTLSIDLWHQGTAILESGDTIKGLIKYDIEDLLQMRRDNHSEIFPAEKVQYFEIYDQTARLLRQFYPLPFLKNQRKPIFFELLSKGKLTLLSREQAAAITYSQSTNREPPKIHRIMAHRYYLWSDDGGIEKISIKPGKVIKLLDDKRDPIDHYINENQLTLKDKYHIKKIFDYYNSLFNITFNAKTSDLSLQR